MHITQELFARDAKVSKLYRGMTAESNFLELTTEFMEIAIYEEIAKKNQKSSVEAQLSIEDSSINNLIKKLKLVNIDHKWLRGLYERAYDGTLNVDNVKNDWANCIKGFYGDSVNLGKEKLFAFTLSNYPFDTSVPSAFVAYKYGFSAIAATMLNGIKNGPDKAEFKENFLEALQFGGSRPIADTLDRLGARMDAPSLRDTLGAFGSKVDAFAAAAGELLSQKRNIAALAKCESGLSRSE